MKKFFSVIFIIIFMAVTVYEYNFFTGGKIEQKLESLTPAGIAVTHLQTQQKPICRNTKTIGSGLYDALTDDEKKVYDIVYDTLINYKPSVFIYQNVKSDRVFELVSLVISQHPEIFWSRGNCTYSNAGKLIFNYPYSRREAQEKKELIEKKAKEIIEKTDVSGDEYERSLAIFDYIVKNTSYNKNAAEKMDEYFEASTIEGVFLNGEAVCSGYSKAYQYLLSLAGIDSITITGNASTPNGKNSHAWTAQKIDGEIYFTDTTWGDSYEASVDAEFASHVYFLINSDEIEKTHKCDKIFSSIKSDSQTNNYFIRQDFYFDKFSLPVIRDRIKNSIERGEAGIELKFTNSVEYQAAQKSLFDDQNIYYILKTIDIFSKQIDTRNIIYNVDDTHNIITIFYCRK